MKDIIAAIATPRGKGGVAIVRISGEGSVSLASKLFSPWSAPKPRYMYYGQMLYGTTVVDKGLAVWFEKGRSFTGEETVELHCHGGERVTSLMLEAAIEAGARPAEAGEFTKRAFLNGMIDLSGAEAVGDMIEADSKAAVLQAGRALSGGLGSKISGFQQKITDMLASIEASIDYPDEVSEQYTRESIAESISELKAELEELIATYKHGRVRKEGISVCIMGRPNAGKSSLLNRLCGRERAIVTTIEGTTRDVLHETVEMGSVAVHLYDTAGLRQSDDCIERIGMDMAREQARIADLVLYLVDASCGIQPDDEQELQGIRELGVKCQRVFNKCDLSGSVDCSEGDICISAKSGEGVDKLRERIISCAGSDTDTIAIASLRHLQALKGASLALTDAYSAAEDMPLDCVAIDLHRCWDELGQITGQTVNEDIISRIFEKFCVGK